MITTAVRFAVDGKAQMLLGFNLIILFPVEHPDTEIVLCRVRCNGYSAFEVGFCFCKLIELILYDCAINDCASRALVLLARLFYIVESVGVSLFDNAHRTQTRVSFR